MELFVHLRSRSTIAMVSLAGLMGLAVLSGSSRFATAASPSSDPPRPPFEFLAFDGFDGKLGLNWKPVRHDPSHISLTKNPGKLTITTQQGSIHQDEKTRGDPSAKNIFVIDNPLAKDADFAVTTCIIGFKPEAAYHQAGLICYDDDDNYLKWNYEYDWPNGGGQTFCFLRETDAKSEITHVASPQEAKTLWLRLTKRGNAYEYAASEDGKTFTVHGEGTWGKKGPKKIGILAKNGGPQGVAEIDACFDFFELRSPVSKK